MTSGVLAAPLVLGIWDRVNMPAATSEFMVFCAVLIQFSLTNGYVPYGSSDVLVPLLVR